MPNPLWLERGLYFPLLCTRYCDSSTVSLGQWHTVKKGSRVTTKLSLGGNNDVINKLFLSRGSLVSDIPAGDGKLVNLFLRCMCSDPLEKLDATTQQDWNCRFRPLTCEEVCSVTIIRFGTCAAVNMNMLTGTVMTDGCVHLLYNSSWKFYQLAAGQLLPGQTVRYGKAGGMDRPSRTKSHPAGSLSSS